MTPLWPLNRVRRSDGRAICRHFGNIWYDAWNAEAAFDGSADRRIARECVADADKRRNVRQVNSTNKIVDDVVDAVGDSLICFGTGVHILPCQAQFIAQVCKRPAADKRNVAEPASGGTTRYIHHTPQSMGRKFCASTHGEAHFTPLEPSAAKHTHRRNACALFHAHRQQRQANAADCAQNARQQKEALPPPHRHPQD